MHRGYVKQWRKELESEVFTDPDPLLYKVWCWIKLRANHKATKYHGIEIQPGQFVTSILNAADVFGISRAALRRRLDRLEEMGNITRKPDNKRTTITICKWDTYAENKSEKDDEAANKRPSTVPTTGAANGQQVDQQPAINCATNKNEETGKNLGDESPKNPSCPEAEIPPSVPEPPILVFPVVGKQKEKTWPLEAMTFESLKMAFPDLDVLGECRKALGWIEADPKRRKTPRGMRTYLFGWMSRAQNAGRARAFAASKPSNGIDARTEAWQKALEAAGGIPDGSDTGKL